MNSVFHRVIKGHVIDSEESSRVEAGSNTSTVAQRVVRRQKGKSRIGDSKIWSRVPWDSDPRMIALARASSSCKRQTRPLIRQRAPHQQTRNCLKVIKIWS
jgi:hypothetical protein